MALSACVECGHAVGRFASTCPQCGCPEPTVAFRADTAHDVAMQTPSTADDGRCDRCGQQLPSLAKFCSGCGASAGTLRAPPAAHPRSHLSKMASADARMIEKIAGYERMSAIIWLVFGILQIISVVAVIAGIWNVLAALSRFRLSPMIRLRDPGIPAIYEGVGQLIVIGVVNVLVGGVIGILFVGFDFYVRGLVLDHRHLFASDAPARTLHEESSDTQGI